MFQGKKCANLSGKRQLGLFTVMPFSEHLHCPFILPALISGTTPGVFSPRRLVLPPLHLITYHPDQTGRDFVLQGIFFFFASRILPGFSFRNPSPGLANSCSGSQFKFYLLQKPFTAHKWGLCPVHHQPLHHHPPSSSLTHSI